MGYEVVRSYFETREIDCFGAVKLLIREIIVDDEPRRTMPMTSQAIAFYPYDDIREIRGRNTPQYRELKRLYPDCTPHHDVDGYHIVPTLIHRAFPHFGPIAAEERYMRET